MVKMIFSLLKRINGRNDENETLFKCFYAKTQWINITTITTGMSYRINNINVEK